MHAAGLAQNASLLISVLGVVSDAGDKMAVGASPREKDVAAHSWSAVQPEDWQQQGCWEPATRSSIGGRVAAGQDGGQGGSGGGGREGGISQVAQRVIAASGQFAGDREDRQLAVQPLLHRPEVGVVRGGWTPCVDGRLVEGPTQHRRALLGEVALGLLAVRRVDGDVEPGVANGVIGTREAPTVAHLRPDGHRGKRADSVVLALQGPAGGL